MVIHNTDYQKQPSVEKSHRILASASLSDRTGQWQKEMTGQNDIELEISNQGGRLLNIIIIYYNSALLSHLSPLGWEHIILIGDYHIG